MGWGTIMVMVVLPISVIHKLQKDRVGAEVTERPRWGRSYRKTALGQSSLQSAVMPCQWSRVRSTNSSVRMLSAVTSTGPEMTEGVTEGCQRRRGGANVAGGAF